MKNIEVVAAIINFNNKFLCVQRGLNKYDYISKKYEFPGGKIEINETHEFALRRELMEELNLAINIKQFFLKVEHTYPDFHLIMHSYICTCKDSNLELKEHIDFKWLSADKISTLDWAAADIAIVEKLRTA